MAKLLDGQLHRLNVYFEETEGAEVIGPLDGVLDITRRTTAAEVRAKIKAEGLGAHPNLPRPVAELQFCFLAHDQGSFSVVSRAQEDDSTRPVLGPRFAFKDEAGNWSLVLRGSGILARAAALDPEQAGVLRGEVDGLRGGGGEAKGADVVGEIADILADLQEERNEQGKVHVEECPAC